MNGTGLQAWRRDAGALRQLGQEKARRGFPGWRWFLAGAAGRFLRASYAACFPSGRSETIDHWRLRSEMVLARKLRRGQSPGSMIKFMGTMSAIVGSLSTSN
ncbi:hypothetical protein FHX06_001442 [Rhizobium sp. BK512]|uniref:hypothetical protein n=1 Tax=Rhizobium sp. BK512 TaxID=2587010 RepID=UPI0016071DB5|nr:hypothetical protein [Rhizobium sp. BK512]MBB3560131.1 hypothetical protein [Rhizobium sp. BK512]